ncbi:hypothetical protein [Formosa haliotis]|uniref:hypothetical protein n=1 Tax=Formosa haliotis TaxID=1555194 RepID=UPI000824E86D|nr:hypothetical protein [Formosa haliotis]
MNIIIILGIIFFPLVFALYYSKKEKKRDEKKIIRIRPHRGYMLLLILVQFCWFAIGMTILFFSVKGIIKIVLYDYSLPTLFGLIILSILAFFSVFMIPFFLVLVNHLWVDLNKNMYYNVEEKILNIDGNAINLLSDTLRITIYKPTLWIINPIVSNNLRWKNYDLNRKIEFSDHFKTFEISKLNYIPNDLNQMILKNKNLKIIRKKFNWMKPGL